MFLDNLVEPNLLETDFFNLYKADISIENKIVTLSSGNGMVVLGFIKNK